MRVLTTIAFACLLSVTGPTAQAAWQDSVAVSGSTVSTVEVEAPVVQCHDGFVLDLFSLEFSWDHVSNATRYVVTWGLTGTKEVLPPQTSTRIPIGVGGQLKVTAWFGSEWSATSEPVPYFLLTNLFGPLSASCTSA